MGWLITLDVLLWIAGLYLMFFTIQIIFAWILVGLAALLLFCLSGMDISDIF